MLSSMIGSDWVLGERYLQLLSKKTLFSAPSTLPTRESPIVTKPQDLEVSRVSGSGLTGLRMS